MAGLTIRRLGQERSPLALQSNPSRLCVGAAFAVAQKLGLGNGVGCQGFFFLFNHRWQRLPASHFEGRSFSASSQPCARFLTPVFQGLQSWGTTRLHPCNLAVSPVVRNLSIPQSTKSLQAFCFFIGGNVFVRRLI